MSFRLFRVIMAISRIGKEVELMSKKNILYAQPPRQGKTAMIEFEKQVRGMDHETFHKALKKLLVKKCECGAILPAYPYYTETTEFVICGNCGKRHERSRVNRRYR